MNYSSPYDASGTDISSSCARNLHRRRPRYSWSHSYTTSTGGTYYLTSYTSGTIPEPVEPKTRHHRAGDEDWLVARDLLEWWTPTTAPPPRRSCRPTWLYRARCSHVSGARWRRRSLRR